MKLLSLLISLVMMLSGGYMAEDPNAAASTQITIRDLAVEIQGEHYSLNPSITLGASTENGAALLDLYMALNDQTLFPVQAKIDEAGAGVLLGSSTTAYTFAPELFDEMLGGEEIPDEAFTMIDSYAKLMTSMPTYDTAKREEINLASINKLLELAGDVEVTEATFTADDKEQTGKHFAFELDNAAVAEWVDYSITMMPEEYADAYSDYLKTTIALAGHSVADSISDLKALSGMEMSISGEVTYNETSSVWNIIFHTVVDQASLYLDMGYTEEDIAEMGIEPIAMDMPMTMIYHNADNMELIMEMEQEGVTIDMTAFVIDGGYMTMGMTISEPDMATMNLALDMLMNKGSITVTNLNMVMDIEGTVITFTTETVPGDEISTTTVAFSYYDEAFSGSASFFIDVTHDAIADRISGANVQTIATSEDLEGTASTGLSLAAMSMMGDVEKLLNDESVAEFVAVMEQFFGYSETEAEAVYEDVEEYSGEPEFAEPVFNWLPEGYALTSSSYEGDYGCYSFTFGKSTETAEVEMYADVYYYGEDYADDDSYFHFSVDGDEIQRVNGDLISVTNYDEYFNVYGNIGSMYIDLTVEDAEVTAEELVKILSQITIPE